MKVFAFIAGAVGAVIVAVDVVSRLTHGYNVNTDHGIAILLIANLAAVSVLWAKSPLDR